MRENIIEAHPDKLEIEKAILSGESVRAIAKRFNIPKSSVQRHKTDRMKTGIQAYLQEMEQGGIEAKDSRGDGLINGDTRDSDSIESRDKRDRRDRDIATGKSVIERIAKLNQEMEEYFYTLKEEGRIGLSIQAFRELMRALELQAKLCGELKDDEIKIAIVLPPGMEQMRTVSGGQRN